MGVHRGDRRGLVVGAAVSGAAAFDAKLKRYPYLTDLVGTSVMVNWATDISATSAVVKYGLAGGTLQHQHRHRDAHLHPRQRRLRVSVEGPAHGPRGGHAVLLPRLLRQRAARPAGHRRVAGLPHPDPGRLVGAVQVRRVRRLGQDARGRQPGSGERDLADRRRAARASPSRPATTPTRSAARRATATSTRPGTTRAPSSAPTTGRSRGRRCRSSRRSATTTTTTPSLLTNWPQDTAVATSGGRYQTDTYCCQNGTTSGRLSERLVRVRRRPWPASTCSTTAWDDTNVGTATPFKNDFDNHWGPNSPQYQWLANDLATHPRARAVRVLALPARLRQQREPARTRSSREPNSLEGLLKLYDVTAGFNGHSHNYQRNTAPSGGIPTHITGGGGANLESIGATAGCSATDAYGIGWSQHVQRRAAPAAPGRFPPRRTASTTSCS